MCQQRNTMEIRKLENILNDYKYLTKRFKVVKETFTKVVEGRKY